MLSYVIVTYNLASYHKLFCSVKITEIRIFLSSDILDSHCTRNFHTLNFLGLSLLQFFFIYFIFSFIFLLFLFLSRISYLFNFFLFPDAVIKNPFKNIRGDVVTPPRRAVTTTSRGVPNGNQN